MDNYKEMLIDKNLYKRGFLLLKRQEKLPSIVSEWEQIELPTDLLLAYEAGNQCFFGSFSGGWLCLCGSYCMDVAAGHMSFRSVGEKMLRSLQQSQELFFDYLDVLNGRFVCIYSFGDSVFVLNDATGSRSVFYSTEKPALASHYNLLHEAIGGEEDPFYQKFSTLVIQKQKEHKIQPWVLPGDMTPYKNVRILVPNHLLELSQMKMQRFWPRKNMRALDVDEACNYIALSIKKEAELLCRHYKVFESLTAGTDSRITLAAVKNVAKDITFFTYHNVATKVAGYELCDREQNFKFASDLCRKEGLSFVEIQFEENEISPLLRAIYKKNHYL